MAATKYTWGPILQTACLPKPSVPTVGPELRHKSTHRGRNEKELTSAPLGAPPVTASLYMKRHRWTRQLGQEMLPCGLLWQEADEMVKDSVWEKYMV